MEKIRKRKSNRNIYIAASLSTILLIILIYLLISFFKSERTINHDFPVPLMESQILELSLKSDYMGREMPFLIYLPKGYGDGFNYPVWYGLNSYSTNESMWPNSGITEKADQMITDGEIDPLIMVFPYVKDATIKEIAEDIETDGKVDERNIDQYICKELIPYIDANYYTNASPKGRYIGGFSMGGMIALRIAFHHTDLFSKIGGYSAAVTSSNYADRQLEEWLYPNLDSKEILDPLKFAKDKGFDKLNVYLDAGNSNDPFSVGLQSLYEALQNRGVKVEFQLYDGGHTLRISSLTDYLKFYNQ